MENKIDSGKNKLKKKWKISAKKIEWKKIYVDSGNENRLWKEHWWKNIEIVKK